MANTPLRIVFAGTPDFAAYNLQALLDSDHQVIAVYTQPDKKGKRKNQMAPRPVKDLAQAHNIPVFQPTSLKTEEEQQVLANLEADIMVVVAYGMLLPPSILETPRLGCINVHGSLLPRWRGAAPVERSMLAGDAETGVTIMQMDEGLDTGDMLLKAATPINETDTAASLFDRLSGIGATALIETLNGLCEGNIAAEMQDNELATYAHKLSKEEGVIDWNQSAEAIDLKIRALSPRIAVTFQLEGETIKLLECERLDQQGVAGQILPSDKKSIVVGCGEGAIKIKMLQLPGKKPMDAASVLNSKREQFSAGVQLG
ncbi:methionyl-tRNA formyltransferase [Neptuniibacter sp. 1_MG-2023]|uniref:methionyl-tRNA formyltransferase n=1 Tax=Neptuniibacter sp. 1_MG-2023 TaxID=3062662 RepID=UPI0026E25101|nr:methionyl-tRNA formyltransferase [Neptuniibacter sp. 1_MG-2023]MDO6594093.1 methionyl-tRNA formyltransferase [Neptuniibacter sp. 1_MG-2023]